MSLLKPTVLIADDHPLVAEGLRQLLESDFEVLGTVGDGDELVSQARSLRPQVILLDAVIPPQNGFSTARRLKEQVPNSRIVFVTMLEEPTHVSEAFRVGAKGYVLKQALSSDLIKAVHAVLRNERYLSPGIMGEVRDSVEFPWTKPGGFTNQLTERQKQVLQLLSRGDSTKMIAQTLQISQKTVLFHKTSIFKKIGLRSPSDLTKFALTQGLTSLGTTRRTSQERP
ncbi:MAG: response regulator transcription factor [Nitrospira sp.]|nr:response regulator transcription factor [Nitrospira sp.]MBS0154416.1 response regulator transcription factor [Nitrospira sp.]MBS0166964.1 response regulator transcription factor [Nitrospira sp.]